MARKKAKSRSQKTSKSSLAQAMGSSTSSSSMATTQMSAQQLTMVTVLWFLAHSAIIYLANMWFPNSVVLGTNVISPMMGILYSMVVFTLLTVGSIPVIELVSTQMRIKMMSLHWFGTFAVINTVGLWIVARFAEQLGMGLSSWMVAVALAVVMDIAQGMLVQVASRK
ncbi:MAG TPA: hypothetical protein VF209_04075 [Patescibacteria group bacterium]